MLKPSHFITYLNDILFWTIVLIIVFSLIFLTNDGELRWYTFLGIILGVVFYNLLFSNYVINVSSFIINFIRKILLITARILLFPILCLIWILKKPYLVLVKIIKRIRSILSRIKSLFKNYFINTFKKFKIILKKIWN